MTVEEAVQGGADLFIDYDRGGCFSVIELVGMEGGIEGRLMTRFGS